MHYTRNRENPEKVNSNLLVRNRLIAGGFHVGDGPTPKNPRIPLWWKIRASLSGGLLTTDRDVVAVIIAEKARARGGVEVTKPLNI